MLSPVKSQIGAEGNENVGRVIAQLRNDLIEMLGRANKVSIDVAEDAASEAIAAALAADPVEVAIEAARKKKTFEAHLLDEMVTFGRKYIGRERARLKKNISESTPIGSGDDDDLTLGGLFTPRANSAEHIEAYAECMMFFRKHGGEYSASDIEMLFGVAESTDVMTAAKELGLTPENVAKARMAVTKRANRQVE